MRPADPDMTGGLLRVLGLGTSQLVCRFTCCRVSDSKIVLSI